MKRTRIYWLGFLAAFLVVFSALGWLSHRFWLAEAQRMEAIKDGDVQERLRLSLWRIDFAVMGLIADENSRQPEEFAPLYPLWNGLDNRYSKELFPSPILNEVRPEVLLHFEIGTQQKLTSPQVPNTVDWQEVGTLCQNPQEKASAKKELETKVDLTALRAQVAAFPLLGGASGVLTDNVLANAQKEQTEWRSLAGNEAQQAYSGNEFNQRKMLADVNVGRNSQRLNKVFNNESTPSTVPDVPKVSTYRGLWSKGELLLCRRVQRRHQEFIQGVWLDWPELKQGWQESVKDLLPSVSFLPEVQAADAGQTALHGTLAQLPVRLVPGALPLGPMPGKTDLSRLLWGCWSAALIAAGALALLLHRSLVLSERRGAFVSAVTHELRTPLTTFRIYTEMLSREMVPDEAQRKLYLETLYQEAGRLDHLVENVLAFAKLERGSARSRLETLPCEAHLHRLLARLEERAKQGGMTITLECPAELAVTPWTVDVTSLDQILLNLVDNALKYARNPDADTTSPEPLRLQVRPAGTEICLCLLDSGPGVSPNVRKHLFEPFHKSADEAAHTAPGIGLGLSLSRRLARQMGGDLRYSPQIQKGSSFCLTLPMRAGR